MIQFGIGDRSAVMAGTEHLWTFRAIDNGKSFLMSAPVDVMLTATMRENRGTPIVGVTLEDFKVTVGGVFSDPVITPVYDTDGEEELREVQKFLEEKVGMHFEMLI